MENMKDLLNFSLINVYKPAGLREVETSRGSGALRLWVLGRFACGLFGELRFSYLLGATTI